MLSVTYTQRLKLLHTHIALYCFLSVTLYFSFTVVTEIKKNYQLKPRNNTLMEVYISY